MRWMLAALSAGLLLTPAALRADDKEPATRAERWAALQEYEKTFHEFVKAFMAAQTPEAKRAAMAKQPDRARQAKLAEVAQKVIDEDAKDDVAAGALAWLVQFGPPPKVEQALRSLGEHHLASPRMADACKALLSRSIEAPEKLLRDVIARNPDPAAKACARFALAGQLHAQADAGGDANAKDAEAAALLELVVKEAGEVPAPIPQPGTLAATAKPILFEIQHLGVGKQAPEVECQTVEGKKERLSDYRGKVVVIDIWATWCPPCRAMIPHERELVKRLQGKPFALISVSGDDDVETLKKFLEKESMPWVHWFAERKGILTDWNVQFFPTIYVLDAKGVIRYKGVRGEAMDKAVDTLLKELEEKKGGGN
jgi:thiol-disulfide isomerase/thioredoxin